MAKRKKRSEKSSSAKKTTKKKSTGRAATGSEGKKSSEKNSKVSKKKRKTVSVVNIVFLVILVAILVVFAVFFLMDTSSVTQCKKRNQCGMYNTFTFKDNVYVCLNSESAESKAVKDRVLIFKHAAQEGISVGSNSKPSGCSCVENSCKLK